MKNDNLDFDKQEFLNELYAEYVKKNALTAYEKRLLKEWVKKGNSVYSSPGSKYLCSPQYPALSFIDEYRQDKAIGEAIKGLNKKEKEKYLKEYMGYDL